MKVSYSLITYAASLTFIFGSANGGLITQPRAGFLRGRQGSKCKVSVKLGLRHGSMGPIYRGAEKQTNLGIFAWRITFAFLISVNIFLALLTQSLCS